MEIKIGKTILTDHSKPYFIADIAANHDGDINRAFKLIELAKNVGADVAKFQNFKSKYIVSKNGFDTMPKQTHQASWSKSVFEVYDDASLKDDWNFRLKEKCDEIGIEYMTSPYDIQSIENIDSLVNAYKIGSGDITWPKIIEYMAKKGKPIFLATGAANIEDVKRAVNSVYRYNENLILMQCNTNYTANSENYKYINLNVLKTYKTLFPNCILGLSDHTYGYSTVLGALALGAVVFEKHFTDDNNRTGPDHKFSMNPISWKEMVNECYNLYYALGDGIKKVEENEKVSRVVQQRSLFLAHDMKAGEIITEDSIIALRPIRDDGIPPYDILKVLGKKLKIDKNYDTYLTLNDIE